MLGESVVEQEPEQKVYWRSGHTVYDEHERGPTAAADLEVS